MNLFFSPSSLIALFISSFRLLLCGWMLTRVHLPSELTRLAVGFERSFTNKVYKCWPQCDMSSISLAAGNGLAQSLAPLAGSALCSSTPCSFPSSSTNFRSVSRSLNFERYRTLARNTVCSTSCWKLTFQGTSCDNSLCKWRKGCAQFRQCLPSSSLIWPWCTDRWRLPHSQCMLNDGV